MYRPNPNKRAIRIFNNYFIVGLYVVHIDFPIWCWYTLVPQTIEVIYLFSMQILIIHHTTRYTISTNAPMMLLFVHISPFCAFKTYIYIENVWNFVPVFVFLLFQWLIFIIYWQKRWSGWDLIVETFSIRNGWVDIFDCVSPTWGFTMLASLMCVLLAQA